MLKKNANGALYFGKDGSICQKMSQEGNVGTKREENKCAYRITGTNIKEGARERNS